MAREIIQQLQFNPLDINAIDFVLPDLKGSEKKLSSYKGKWILLTFWATWCGPCAMEMPQLQIVNEKIDTKKLQVIGISIDSSSSEKVLDYIENRSLTFPIWHDQNGQVASQYQSRSVPSLYLISPEFKIVGLFQGAAEWGREESVNLLKQLAELKKVAPLSEDQKQNLAPQTEIQIPNNLSPPKMIVDTLPETFFLNELLKLKIKITFPTSSEEYIITPPSIKIPEGLLLGDVTSYSQNDGQINQLIYEYPITLTKEGSFTLTNIEMSYEKRSGSKKLFTRLTDITFSVVKKDRTWMFISIGLFAGFMVFLFGFKTIRDNLQKKKSEKLAIENQSNTEKMKAQKLKEAFEQLTIDKNKVSRQNYDQKILEILMENFQENDQYPKWKSEWEGITYGGKTLEPWQIEHYHHMIKQHIKLQLGEEHL